MSASIVCLFGLIGWSILLMFVLLGARTKYALGGQLVFDQQGVDIGGGLSELREPRPIL